MDVNTNLTIAKILHERRIEQAERARLVAACATGPRLHDRVLMALGKCLIRWGQQLQGLPQSVEAHS